jgi:gluconate 5-dehydrogenase
MATHPFGLAGKIALVTGAYRGLGFAIAKGLCEAGATVVLNGRKPEAARGGGQGPDRPRSRASTSVFDVAKADAVRAGIGAIERDHGRLTSSSTMPASSAESARRFQAHGLGRHHRDQPHGAFLVAQAALPGMIARRSGKIINIASLMSELARPTSSRTRRRRAACASSRAEWRSSSRRTTSR